MFREHWFHIFCMDFMMIPICYIFHIVHIPFIFNRSTFHHVSIDVPIHRGMYIYINIYYIYIYMYIIFICIMRKGPSGFISFLRSMVLALAFRFPFVFFGFSFCWVQCSFISFDFLSCPFCSMQFLLFLFISFQLISFHFLSFSLVAIDFLRFPSFFINLNLHVFPLGCFFCLLFSFEIDVFPSVSFCFLSLLHFIACKSFGDSNYMYFPWIFYLPVHQYTYNLHLIVLQTCDGICWNLEI